MPFAPLKLISTFSLADAAPVNASKWIPSITLKTKALVAIEVLASLTTLLTSPYYRETRSTKSIAQAGQPERMIPARALVNMHLVAQCDKPALLTLVKRIRCDIFPSSIVGRGHLHVPSAPSESGSPRATSEAVRHFRH